MSASVRGGRSRQRASMSREKSVKRRSVVIGVASDDIDDVLGNVAFKKSAVEVIPMLVVNRCCRRRTVDCRMIDEEENAEMLPTDDVRRMPTSSAAP